MSKSIANKPVEFDHPLLQTKEKHEGYAVFTFKFNGVPIKFMALSDVKAISRHQQNDTPTDKVNTPLTRPYDPNFCMDDYFPKCDGTKTHSLRLSQILAIPEVQEVISKSHKEAVEEGISIGVSQVEQKYADRFNDLRRHYSEQYPAKGKLAKVIIKHDGDSYVAMVTQFLDTNEGIFIEGEI